MQKYISFCETVIKHLGKGYTENIYQEALCALLRQNEITYSKEQVVPIDAFGCNVGFIRTDITIPNESVVIECKAIPQLNENYFPQIITYMEHLLFYKGIFVNFVQSPIKQPLQIYTVEKQNLQYIFRDVYTQSTSLFTPLGSKIIIDNESIFSEWIKDNLVKDHDSILLKSTCKSIYDKIYGQKDHSLFLTLIEKFCEDNFKDKQSNGIKFKQCIFNYKIK